MKCCWVNLVELVEIAEDNDIFWQAILGPGCEWQVIHKWQLLVLVVVIVVIGIGLGELARWEDLWETHHGLVRQYTRFLELDRWHLLQVLLIEKLVS